MQSNFTTTAVGRHFVESLAYHPLAGNAKNKILHCDREEAIGKRYLGPDLPYAIQWLKLDIDTPKEPWAEHTAARYLDEGLPAPHFIVMHGDTFKNLGSHYYYGFHTPIEKSIGSRPGPLALFATICNGYTRALGADRSYTGGTLKNPAHPGWGVIVNDLLLYGALELLEALPANLQRPVRQGEALGEGRNTDLFTRTRLWAYTQIGAAYQAGHLDAWRRAVLTEAKGCNAYPTPLPAREVHSVAKSVSDWTWKHAEGITGGTGQRMPRTRSQQFSWRRDQITSEEARQRMSEGAEKTSAIKRGNTYDAITGALGVLAGQGVTRPTQSQISQAAGVSLSTVERWARGSRAGQNSN